MASNQKEVISIVNVPASITITGTNSEGESCKPVISGISPAVGVTSSQGKLSFGIEYPGEYTITYNDDCCTPEFKVTENGGDVEIPPGASCDEPSYSSECPDSPLIAAVEANTTAIVAAINDRAAETQAILNNIDSTLTSIESLVQSESDETQTSIDELITEVRNLISANQVNFDAVISNLSDLKAELEDQGISLDNIDGDLDLILSELQSMQGADFEVLELCVLDASGNKVPGAFVAREKIYNSQGITQSTSIVIKQIDASGAESDYTLQTGESIGECPVGTAPGADCSTPSYSSECPDSPLMTAINEVNSNLQTINQSINDTSQQEQNILNSIDTTLGEIQVLIQSESDETQSLISDLISDIGDLSVDIGENHVELIAKLDELLAELSAANVNLGDIEQALQDILAAIQALDSTDDDWRPTNLVRYCDSAGLSAWGYFKVDETGDNVTFVKQSGDDVDLDNLVDCNAGCQYERGFKCFSEIATGKVFEAFYEYSVSPCSGEFNFYRGTVTSKEPCAPVAMDEVIDFLDTDGNLSADYTELSCCPLGLSAEDDPVGRATIQVDTVSATTNIVSYTATKVSGSDMTVTWPDGQTDTWSGGGVTRTMPAGTTGVITFEWDGCDPPVTQDQNFYGAYAGDIAQLNQMPETSGGLELDVTTRFTGNVATLTPVFEGYYNSEGLYTQGPADAIVNRATRVKLQGAETFDVSSVGPDLTHFLAYYSSTSGNRISLRGDMDQMPEGIKSWYNTVGGSQADVTFTTAGLPRSLTQDIRLDHGITGSGLFEDLPPNMASEPGEVPGLAPRVYIAIRPEYHADTGENLGGNWNNYDFSNSTAHIYALYITNRATTQGDIEQLFDQAEDVEIAYLHASDNDGWAKISGDADAIQWPNKRNMHTFHVLTRGDMTATLGNGPNAYSDYYFYGRQTATPGSDEYSTLSGQVSELSTPDIRLEANASYNDIGGDISTYTGDPSYTFLIGADNPDNPITGDATGIAPNPSFRWSIFGNGNKATVDLSTAIENTAVHYVDFYGGWDGLDGGIATMSSQVLWPNIRHLAVEMTDQQSMTNALLTVAASSYSGGNLLFNQPDAPLDTAAINAAKANGWNIRVGGTYI